MLRLILAGLSRNESKSICSRPSLDNFITDKPGIIGFLLFFSNAAQLIEKQWLKLLYFKEDCFQSSLLAKQRRWKHLDPEIFISKARNLCRRHDERLNQRLFILKLYFLSLHLLSPQARGNKPKILSLPPTPSRFFYLCLTVNSTWHNKETQRGRLPLWHRLFTGINISNPYVAAGCCFQRNAERKLGGMRLSLPPGGTLIRDSGNLKN